MKMRLMLVSVMLSAALTVAGGMAPAQEPVSAVPDPLAVPFPPPGCLPGMQAAYNGHVALYGMLLNVLTPKIPVVQQQLAAVTGQPTYATLLATAHTVANGIHNGRLVVTVPDGTVVLDTGKP